MAHARRRVIDAVVLTLKNLATTGINLVEDPAAAISDGTLPAAVVEVGAEEVERLGEALSSTADGFSQLRRLTIDVAVFAKSATSRDQSTLEVEEVMARADIGSELRLVRTQFQANSEGAFRVWSALVTFEVAYVTTSIYPRTEH